MKPTPKKKAAPMGLRGGRPMPAAPFRPMKNGKPC